MKWGSYSRPEAASGAHHSLSNCSLKRLRMLSASKGGTLKKVAAQGE
jgi:hypothetical protein